MASRDKDRTNLNYAVAIGVSALVHAAFIYLVLFALPRWLTLEQTPPPAYTVAIVDNLPAGDLGTHLPPLSTGAHHHKAPPPPQEEPPPEPEEKAPSKSASKIDAPNSDRNAIALSNVYPTDVPTQEPTPTPTPQPLETPEATAAPTQAPNPAPTARPTRRPRPTARPTPRPMTRPRIVMRPTPRPHGAHRLKPPAPKLKPKIMLAGTPPSLNPMHNLSVRERLKRLHAQLEAENRRAMAQMARARPRPPAAPETGEDNGEDTGDDTGGATEPANGERGGGGPVAGNSVTNGRGYGVGSGTGSLGILRDQEFLLYYQKVQERIKDAWTFASGSKDLTTTVNFAIGPDGRLRGLEIAHSSNNASFDESVERAIRRAAPFPPPPERYRDQFAQGVQAVFKLGELRS